QARSSCIDTLTGASVCANECLTNKQKESNKSLHCIYLLCVTIQFVHSDERLGKFNKVYF
uniref:Uncharacterized protein n=1 Tax=Ciona intestinalis TaxID=7719 RepID=H2XSX7_CIOIN